MTALRWIGNAPAIQDLWTISAPSGTIVSQTYSVTINGKSVSYTAGGSDTASVILAGLQAALSSIANAPPPEFQELTWTALPVGGPYTSLTGTMDVAGVPAIVTVGTGGAATFTIANTTAASGPNWFSVAQNWDQGTAPANSSTCYFDNGSIPCLYGLSTALTGVTVVVSQGYSGLIGLPSLNQQNSNSGGTYSEYRTTSLTLAGGIFTLNSTSVQRCNIAFGAHTSTILIQASSLQRLLTNVPVVLVTGGNSSSTLAIIKGDVGVAFYENSTAQFTTVNTGYATNPSADVKLFVGVGTTLTTVTKNGGYVELHSSAVTLSQDYSGGVLALCDAITVTTVNAYGGTIQFSTTGTVGTFNLYGNAVLSCAADPRAHTITNPINVYAGQVQINDPAKTINSGVLSIAANGLQSVNFNFGGITSLVVN